MKRIDALLAPAEIREWASQDHAGAICVVFDVFRATSTLLAALAAGASGVWPVDDIAAALALQEQLPGAVLAGERGGLRITPAMSGGRGFDLGNSPREFTPDAVGGRPVIMTTTNGTRALHACRGARAVLAASFGNLGATARWLRHHPADRWVFVGAGTGEQSALEDTLGVGALAERVSPFPAETRVDDAVLVAHRLYREALPDAGALARSGRNGRRLAALPELAGDLEVCLALDCHDFAAVADASGALRRVDA